MSTDNQDIVISTPEEVLRQIDNQNTSETVSDKVIS